MPSADDAGVSENCLVVGVLRDLDIRTIFLGSNNVNKFAYAELELQAIYPLY